MLRRMIILIVFGCFLPVSGGGCGPGFKSESEELEYLQSLSNPTVTQFQRRKELQRKEELHQFEIAEAERRERATAEAKEAVRLRPFRAQQALETARSWEGFRPTITITWYQKVVDDFPGTPAAAEAQKRVDELKALIAAGQ